MKIWMSSLIIVVIMVGTGGMAFAQKQGKSNETAHTNFINAHTPTLFLHGTQGTLNSLSYLIDQAEDKGVTKDVIIAHVAKDGTVNLEGNMSEDAINPIIQIELEDNENMDLNQNAKWIKHVLTTLQNKYHIQSFNFVGHSMGNTSFAQYMLNYGNDTSLPQLKKQVNISGPYNGVLGMNESINEIEVDEQGKPSRMIPPYQGFLKLKEVYKGKNIEVLNMYGDILDDTHSDGVVSVSSSKSLKYLLGDSPKSYKEIKYEGDNAQHSAIHDNPDVANDLISFLWDT